MTLQESSFFKDQTLNNSMVESKWTTFTPLLMSQLNIYHFQLWVHTKKIKVNSYKKEGKKQGKLDLNTWKWRCELNYKTFGNFLHNLMTCVTSHVGL